VPGEVGDWLSQTEESLCLKRCGYWLSLRGQPAVGNKTFITVEIQRQNIFSTEGLKSIMSRIAVRESL